MAESLVHTYNIFLPGFEVCLLGVYNYIEFAIIIV